MKRLVGVLAPLALAVPLLVAAAPVTADDRGRTTCTRHHESDRHNWAAYSTEVKATIHYKVCRQHRDGRDRRWVTIRSTDHWIIHLYGDHNICAIVDFVAWKSFRATSDIDHVHLPAGLKHDCREDQVRPDGKLRLHIDWALWMTDRHRRLMFHRDQPEWVAKVVPHLEIEIPHHPDKLTQRKPRGYFHPVTVTP